MYKNLILLLLWSSFAVSQNKADSLPVLTDFVNDFEGILQLPQEMILEEAVKSFYEENGIGITIVTVASIDPYDAIPNYALDLAIASNRGKILIVVSKKLRQIQIQSSDSISDKLTSEEITTIVETHILPRFKEDDYFKGILNGTMELKKQFN